MVTGELCPLCLGSVVGPASHCYGSSDRPSEEGEPGGFSCSCYCRGLEPGPIGQEAVEHDRPAEPPMVAPPSAAEFQFERRLADELAAALRDTVVVLDSIATSGCADDAQVAQHGCQAATPAYARYQQVRGGLAEPPSEGTEAPEPRVVFGLGSPADLHGVPNGYAEILEEVTRVAHLAERLFAGATAIVDERERAALADQTRRAAQLLNLYGDTLHLVRPAPR